MRVWLFACVRSQVASGFPRGFLSRQTRNVEGNSGNNMDKLSQQGNSEDKIEKVPVPEHDVKETHNESKPASNPKKKRNKKRKKGKVPEEDDDTAKVPAKNIPNYFLGVQITNPSIKGGLKALQDNIVKHDKRLRQAVVNVKSAHLTLGLLYLPSEESLAQACDVLRGCQDKVADILHGTPLVLNVSSIGTFGGKVLFAKISPGEDAQKLGKIAEMAGNEFEAFKSSNAFDYKPHITLMKLSKAPKIRKKVRRIESSYYEKLTNVNIGVQTAETLQLLSMLKKKQPSGYYHCECEISLDPVAESKQSSPDDDSSAYSAFVSAYSVMSAFCDLTSSAAESTTDVGEAPQAELDPMADAETVLEETVGNSEEVTKDYEKKLEPGVNEDPVTALLSVTDDKETEDPIT